MIVRLAPLDLPLLGHSDADLGLTSLAQTRKLAPALAAGCTAVIKAPPETPLSALALAALVEKAGFPKGVVNILTTNKNTVDVGFEMTTNPDVRKVSFTGSSPVGALLMKQASSTLKKCSFELGGNAIFAVFADADIPKAVDGLIASKFRLSGQTCVCANRIFIHEDVYDEFAKQFIAKGPSRDRCPARLLPLDALLG
jgi:succinate-semialdehyde dehydrogenase/glutarate-semialdehyde dehydrogenase